MASETITAGENKNIKTFGNAISGQSGLIPNNIYNNIGAGFVISTTSLTGKMNLLAVKSDTFVTV